MLVYAFCPRCKIDIPIKSNALTRSELEDEKGLYVTTSCSKCQTKREFHVNQISAKVHPRGLKFAIIASLILFIVMTVVLYITGFWSAFTFVLPIAIVSIYRAAQNREVNDFNNYRINRK